MQTKNEAGKKALEIKNAAIAFGVYGDGSKRLGDVALTNKGIVWSKGAAKSTKDVSVKWDAFINWMQSQLASPAKTAKIAKTAKKPVSAKSRIKAAANGARVSTKAAPAKKAPAKKARVARAAPKAKSASKKVH